MPGTEDIEHAGAKAKAREMIEHLFFAAYANRRVSTIDGVQMPVPEDETRARAAALLEVLIEVAVEEAERRCEKKFKNLEQSCMELAHARIEHDRQLQHRDQWMGAMLDAFQELWRERAALRKRLDESGRL